MALPLIVAFSNCSLRTRDLHRLGGHSKLAVLADADTIILFSPQVFTLVRQKFGFLRHFRCTAKTRGQPDCFFSLISSLERRTKTAKKDFRMIDCGQSRDEPPDS